MVYIVQLHKINLKAPYKMYNILLWNFNDGDALLKVNDILDPVYAYTIYSNTHIQFHENRTT